MGKLEILARLCLHCPNPLKEEITRRTGHWECRRNSFEEQNVEALTREDYIPVDSECKFKCFNGTFEYQDKTVQEILLKCQLGGFWNQKLVNLHKFLQEAKKNKWIYFQEDSFSENVNISDFNNVCPIGGCELTSFETKVDAELVCNTSVNVFEEKIVPFATNCLIECNDHSIRMEITKYERIRCLACVDSGNEQVSFDSWSSHFLKFIKCRDNQWAVNKSSTPIDINNFHICKKCSAFKTDLEFGSWKCSPDVRSGEDKQLGTQCNLTCDYSEKEIEEAIECSLSEETNKWRKIGQVSIVI